MWVAPNVTFDYVITAVYGTFGPYPATTAGNGGGSGGGTVQPTPQFRIFIQPNPGTNAIAGPSTTSLDAVAPVLQGFGNIDLFATGGGNNGQGNFFASDNCVAGGSCAAVIPPNSPDTTGPGLGFSTSKLSSIVTDYRANSQVTISFNPQLNFASIFAGGTQALFSSQVDYTEASPALTQGSDQTMSSREYLNGSPGFVNSSSGCPIDCPNPPHNNVSQWAFHNVDTLFASFNGSGINNTNTKNSLFATTGDSQTEADFETIAGGALNGSDEGHHWMSDHLQTVGDYQCVVSTLTDSSHFLCPAFSGTSTQGQGRFIVNLSTLIQGTDSSPLLNVPVAVINKPGDVAVYGTVQFQATNIPNSTFQGFQTTACNVPVQEGGVANCTTNVTVTTGQLCAVGTWNGSSCTGSVPAPVCMAAESGNAFNFAQPVSVTSPSGGSQNLTVSVHRSTPIGAVVFQGGVCPGTIDLNESEDISNVVGIFAYPVIGSFGGNSVAYINYTGSQVASPIPDPGSSWGSRDVNNTNAAHGFAIINLARHSNVVTGTSTTGFDSDKWKELAGAFDFNVSGCTSDPTLNSISVGSPIIFTGPDPSVGNPHIAEIAYTQSGPDTVTPCSAVIATQFTAASLSWAAEVYDVMDHSAAVVNGTFVTSPQPNFPVGATLDSPTNYSAAYNGIQVSGEAGQPLKASTGFVSVQHGYSALVGSSFDGQNFATNVMGANGIQNPLTLLQGDGLYGVGMNLGAPPNNGSAIRLEPPSTLFANQDSSFRRYGLFQLDFGLNSAKSQLLFDDDTQSYWWTYNFSQYPSMIFGPDLINLAVQSGTTRNIPTQIGELRFAEFGSNGNIPFGPLFHIKQCAPLQPLSVTSICYSSFTPTNAVVTPDGIPGSTLYQYILQWNDVAGPAYGQIMQIFNGNSSLAGGNSNSIPCGDMPGGTTGIVWEFNNSIGFSEVGVCTSPTTILHDTGSYSSVVGPNGTIAGSIESSGGFEATGLLGGYYFSQPDIYGTSTPALTRTAGISQLSAGVLSVDTTSQGNGLGRFQMAAITTQTFTVSTLPSASSLPAGTQVVVSDASTFTPGTCTGGGSDYMIAITSGSAWSCH
jgi:hypothetical protein